VGITRVITTQWHTTYREPTQIDEPGQRTNYTYDGSGNVLTKTISDVATSETRTWTYTYNAMGQVLTIDGPRTDVNDVTTFTYNECTSGSGCGQLATVTDAVGNVTQYLTYNADGNPLTISDPNGSVTTLTYDARQRLTSRAVGTETTTYDYWPTGLLKKATLPDGSYLSYTYDAAHRLTGIEDGEGNRIVYTLDAAGNRTKEEVFDPSNALARTRSYVFDALGRLHQEIGAASQTVTYEYDDAGNRLSMTDARDRLTLYDYDALNRQSAITDPIGQVTQFTYDARDNLASVSDPRQLQTTYTYNGFNDVVALSSPDSGVSGYTQDSAGDLHVSTDARGRQAEYSYDALGRVTDIEYSDQTMHFSYDTGPNAKGHLSSVTDGSGSTQYTYDSHGRVTSKTHTVGSVTRTVGYSYNAAGQLASSTTPSGQVIAYTYTNNRVTSVTVNSTTILSQVLYSPFGATRGWQWGNGSITAREYDTDGQLTTIESAGLSTYTYYPDGTIHTRDDDAPAPDNAVDGSLGIAISNASNRIDSTVATPSSVTRTYAYDASGNTTSDGAHTFTYNDAGRMITAMSGGSPITYAYNALGQRVKKSGPGGTVYFAYDESGHLIGQYDVTGALIEELVWLGDIPIASIRISTSGGIGFFYIHTDHLNTPVRLTRTSDNAIMWRWDHDPYGGVAPDEDADNNGAFVFFNPRLPGQYHDSESGLNHNYFRDYDPYTGRYLESDPIGLDGGINTYAYVGDNPVGFADLYGLIFPNPLSLFQLPWTEERCKRLQQKIDNLNLDIERRYALIRTNPLNLPQWGPTSSSPNSASVNGHYREIDRLDRDRRKNEQDYDRHCRNNCPPGSPVTDPSPGDLTTPTAGALGTFLIIGGVLIFL
jgi:RHS repeat-associated protein